MKLLTIFKTALNIGSVALPVVLNAVSPGVGTLVGSVLTSVLRSEAVLGPGQGDKKKQFSLECLQVAAPAIVQLIERQTGKELTDEEQFTEGVAWIQEGIVMVLNAFRILPKGYAA
jgi:hypothetical protein